MVTEDSGEECTILTGSKSKIIKQRFFTEVNHDCRKRGRHLAMDLTTGFLEAAGYN